MRIVFASYVCSSGFKNPGEWLQRTNFYTGIPEALSRENEVISIEQIDYEGRYQQNGVDYQFMDFGKRTLLFPWQQHRYIKALQPDVVFVHGLHFALQVIQLRLQLGRRVKIIAQHHAERPSRWPKRYLQQLAAYCIDAYLFTSQAMGLDWMKKAHIRSTGKIHGVMEGSSVFYPVAQSLARAKTGVQGAAAFLWVGRLNDNKDPLTVVRAFLQFTRQYPEARLYMIYHTSELLPEIESLLQSEAAYKDKIVLVGKVPHDDLLYWFNSVPFIISGSHYEGSGIAVCEAMSCGCIPVLTDILSFQLLTNNGHCGVLYAPGNEAALLQALLQVTTLDVAAERSKVLAQFQSQLSFEAIAKKIQEVITSL